MAQNTSLFKFRVFNKISIELLVNKELWFARPDSLNDPFECQYNSNSIFYDSYESLNIHDDSIQKAKKLQETLFSDIGICSFSRTMKNQLMWAHYADEHKGFCIEFNETTLKEDVFGIKSIDVKYQSKIPSQPLINKLKKTAPDKYETQVNGAAIDAIIGTKYTHWKYEKERRLFLVKSGGVPFVAKSIISITFGLRMAQRDKNTLLKLLSSNEWSHLKWYQAEKTKGKFTLNFPLIKT